jgi:hypothetical protein
VVRTIKIDWFIQMTGFISTLVTLYLNHTLNKALSLCYALHNSLNYDQFSVLCANTCQFFKFTFKILKVLNFLKVLKITTCFGQYGHHQMLKSSWGNCCHCMFLRTKQSTENNREHNTPSTTYVRIEGTHAIAAEWQQFPQLDFNT